MRRSGMAQGHPRARHLGQNVAHGAVEFGDQLQIIGQSSTPRFAQSFDKPGIVQQIVGPRHRILARRAPDDLAHAAHRGQRLHPIQVFSQSFGRQIAEHHLRQRPLGMCLCDLLHPGRFGITVLGPHLNMNRAAEALGIFHEFVEKIVLLNWRRVAEKPLNPVRHQPRIMHGRQIPKMVMRVDPHVHSPANTSIPCVFQKCSRSMKIQFSASLSPSRR